MGLQLGRNRAASACIDLSDGLADGVARIAESSGVGITIDAAALPIDPVTREVFEKAGLDPVHAAVTGGDDYELLFTVRPRMRGRLKTAMQHGGGIPVTRIGVCTGEPGLGLRLSPDAEPVPLPRGYTHFR